MRAPPTSTLAILTPICLASQLIIKDPFQHGSHLIHHGRCRRSHGNSGCQGNQYAGCGFRGGVHFWRCTREDHDPEECKSPCDFRLQRKSTDIRCQNQWDAEVAAGEMASELYSELGYTRCIDGLATAIPGDANNTFRCSNVRHLDDCHIKRAEADLLEPRSTCTTSSPTRSLEAPPDSGLRPGDGPPPTAGNSWPSHSSTALRSSRSAARER